MVRGRHTSITIRLTPAQRQRLMAWQRSTTIPAGLARRGRILLLLADGVTITDIAATVGISRRFVYKWVQRFLTQGVEGLAGKPGRGSGRGPRQATPRRSSTPWSSTRIIGDAKGCFQGATMTDDSVDVVGCAASHCAASAS
jgi:Helix-turn-helix domain